MTRAAEINLHELVRLPHDAAEKVLRQAGCWDEFANGEELRSVRVRVTYEVRYEDTETVTVEARSREEAEELAMDKVADMDSDYEPLDAEIIE